MSERRKREISKFTDRFGERRTVYRVRTSRISVSRVGTTPILALTTAIARLVGLRIQAERKRQGLTMDALGVRAGLRGTPKQRIYEIEHALSSGLRTGTIYALAVALGVPVQNLLPTEEEVFLAAGVAFQASERLELSS